MSQLSSSRRPCIEVAVTMRREPIVGAMSRWQSHRWVLDSVDVIEEGQPSSATKLTSLDGNERWIHAGLKVELFTDDAEGYYLNVT
ncbi:MAG: DUF3305 domain-containing protein, partial [Polaromonas sp.]|nr:DUF3305 domain-containing protein [Polaromonas sp.]MBP7115999.1 DUF3305 domain-containing protein [Polaromonas sp.]MBP7309492.1 DUF3305 domain-containing protein [Polaromonas sp.]